jgi:hypothetical protein
MLTEVLNALKQGEIISNPVTWKNKSKVLNSLVAILSFVVAGLKAFNINFLLTPDQIIIISGLIIAVVMLINIIITVVTTKKIGL